MPNCASSVTAAVALVGADVVEGQVWARSPVDRVLTGIGMGGSAAPGDTEVEAFIDEVRVGQFFNTALGFPNQDEIQDLEDLFVPAGAQLRAIVRDAAVTNPLNIAIVIEDADEE